MTMVTLHTRISYNDVIRCSTVIPTPTNPSIHPIPFLYDAATTTTVEAKTQTSFAFTAVRQDKARAYRSAVQGSITGHTPDHEGDPVRSRLRMAHLK